MLGKQVIGTDAVTIGTVKDLAVSVDGRVALQVAKKGISEGGDSDVFVRTEEISAVGDVILLKQASEKAGADVPTQGTLSSSAGTSYIPPPTYPTSPAGGKICARCGFVNNSNSRFCIKCGSSLS